VVQEAQRKSNEELIEMCMNRLTEASEKEAGAVAVAGGQTFAT